MRCKACNAIMAADEMVMREETGELEDLCSTCKKAALDERDVENNDDGDFVLMFGLDKWIE